jgi:prepilin-type N-terminal cleavage/methylation domain-containing protein/prepilin-type processing-associated H-X9-DG protein
VGPVGLTPIRRGADLPRHSTLCHARHCTGAASPFDRFGDALFYLAFAFQGVRIMARRNQLGFTLVELLVVITIIGMLMALVLPAINSVRENARRTQCAQNMDQIAMGAYSYAANKGNFPGYRGNRAGTSSQSSQQLAQLLADASWFVALAPQLEQSVIKDRYEFLIQNPAQFPYVAFAACPSDAPEQLTATQSMPISHLAYVVNAGRQDDQWNLSSPPPNPPDDEANGVFHDLRHPNSRKVTIGMKDGESNTLMLSENINATNWHRVSEAEVTFIFDHNPQSLDPNTGDIKQGLPGRRINDNKNSSSPIPRPSSNHSGGVNVAFCDGRTMFLSETIHYRVLQQLMTPNGYHPSCDVPAINKNYILSANDYANQ